MSYSKTKEEERRAKESHLIKGTGTPAEEEEEEREKIDELDGIELENSKPPNRLFSQTGYFKYL